jgi:hypothetical protein
MRAGSRRSSEYFLATDVSQFAIGWLQAGFSSFAYRLAHLIVPRPIAIIGVGALFYFF